MLVTADKVSELSQQVEQLCQQLDASKSSAREEITRHTYTIEEKEREISQGRSERDFLEADKHKLETALQQQEL